MKNCRQFLAVAFFTLLLSACGGNKVTKPSANSTPEKPAATSQSPKTNNVSPPAPADNPIPIKEPTTASAATTTPAVADYSLLKLANWQDLIGFNEDDLSKAWPAWLQSCTALVNKTPWQNACKAAQQFKATPSQAEITAYFSNYFAVYKASNQDGTETGTITGYYEPLLKGSRKQSAQYPYALYTTPKDLITVELQSQFPELKFKRLRGRVVGNKLVPYLDRAAIDTENSPLKDNAFVYIDDVIDVFFLHIQGSGLVVLEDGSEVHVGYADQNGHAYNSIGRLLIARGELTAATASMQGIKNWVQTHPNQVAELLNSNPSYVFFRELPKGLPGPLGALGVPILAERVVAVDPKYVPLGAPIFLSTTAPNSNAPLKQLMMAQDTGGAIKGGVRADFFWGAGAEAGAKAGAMKQSGEIWVLLPKEFELPQTK